MRLLFLVMTLLLTSGVCQSQAITACDWEAAHPSDPDRVGPGRGSSEVDTRRAIKACRTAVANDPLEARFHYQLGRALVYAADNAGESDAVGMPHLQTAADMRHTQAMFVLGLMHIRHGDYCAAEPWTRAAAGQELKAARISYVNNFLSGAMDSCPQGASIEEMRGYLTSARDQVSGWYENMLLDSLQRQLSARASQEK